jgi:hypothetical protein
VQGVFFASPPVWIGSQLHLRPPDGRTHCPLDPRPNQGPRPDAAPERDTPGRLSLSEASTAPDDHSVEGFGKAADTGSSDRSSPHHGFPTGSVPKKIWIGILAYVDHQEDVVDSCPRLRPSQQESAWFRSGWVAGLAPPGVKPVGPPLIKTIGSVSDRRICSKESADHATAAADRPSCLLAAPMCSVEVQRHSQSGSAESVSARSARSRMRRRRRREPLMRL